MQEIFTNGVPGKGTISKIYKEFTQFNIQKILNSQIKWADCSAYILFKEFYGFRYYIYIFNPL